MKAFKLRAQNRSPERQVQNEVCSWLQMQEAKGIAWGSVIEVKGYYDASKGRYLKPNHPYRKVGVPDWMGSWRGRSLNIEFKAPEVRLQGKVIRYKGTLSQEQRVYLTRAHNAKAIVILAYSLDDVLRNLKLVDQQMGLIWTGDLHPPVPREPNRQGMIMINGQFAGFADTIEELKAAVETIDPRQTDLTDFIKPSKAQP